MFTQGHRVTGKLELVQSLCCKVAWSNWDVQDGWFCKGDDCEKVFKYGEYRLSEHLLFLFSLIVVVFKYMKNMWMFVMKVHQYNFWDIIYSPKQAKLCFGFGILQSMIPFPYKNMRKNICMVGLGLFACQFGEQGTEFVWKEVQMLMAAWWKLVIGFLCSVLCLTPLVTFVLCIHGVHEANFGIWKCLYSWFVMCIIISTL